MKIKLLLVLLVCFSFLGKIEAQIFFSTVGTTEQAAQSVGEPGNDNGVVRVKDAPPANSRVNEIRIPLELGLDNELSKHKKKELLLLFWFTGPY